MKKHPIASAVAIAVVISLAAAIVLPYSNQETCLNALPKKWSEPTEPPRQLCDSTMALGTNQ